MKCERCGFEVEKTFRFENLEFEYDQLCEECLYENTFIDMRSLAYDLSRAADDMLRFGRRAPDLVADGLFEVRVKNIRLWAMALDKELEESIEGDHRMFYFEFLNLCFYEEEEK